MLLWPFNPLCRWSLGGETVFYFLFFPFWILAVEEFFSGGDGETLKKMIFVNWLLLDQLSQKKHPLTFFSPFMELQSRTRLSDWTELTLLVKNLQVFYHQLLHRGQIALSGVTSLLQSCCTWLIQPHLSFVLSSTPVFLFSKLLEVFVSMPAALV